MVPREDGLLAVVAAQEEPGNSSKTLEGKETSAKTSENLLELVLSRDESEANLTVIQVRKKDIAGKGVTVEKIVDCDTVGIVSEEADRILFLSDQCHLLAAGRNRAHRLSLQFLHRRLTGGQR